MSLARADRRRLLFGASALLAVPALAGLPRRAAAQAGPRNIADTLAGSPEFGTLLTMVSRAGFVEDLRGLGPLTVFAPTDAAFQTMPSSLSADLMQQGTGGGSGGGGGGTLSGASPDTVRLRAVLQYHAVRGLYLANQLKPGMQLTTVNGNIIEVVSGPNGGLAVRNPAPATQSTGFGAGGLNIMPPAPITRPDVAASNGVIHVIGAVLLP